MHFHGFVIWLPFALCQCGGAPDVPFWRKGEDAMRAMLIGFGAVMAVAACVGPMALQGPGAAKDYADYCAGCHGAGGDPGPVAQELKLHPVALADLTAMNEGVFPEARVMSKIVGYKKHGEMMGASPGDMPPFEALTEGPVVLYDSGDGVQTPTPLRLVRLMEYVKGLGG